MKALEDEIGYVQLQLENHAELLKNARLGKGGEGAPAEGAKNGRDGSSQAIYKTWAGQSCKPYSQ